EVGPSPPDPLSRRVSGPGPAAAGGPTVRTTAGPRRSERRRRGGTHGRTKRGRGGGPDPQKEAPPAHRIRLPPDRRPLPPPASAAILIDASSDDAFAFVADPYRRRLLLPDNFRDFRVLKDAENAGTRTAFTIVTGQGEFPSEVEVEEWDPPHGLSERTFGED